MTEHSINFGDHGGLVGTICLPHADRQGNAGIGKILFNAGILHRVGPHRINVRLARRLARRGIPSIRFDLSGLGDSARANPRYTFERQAVADLQAAMDQLETIAGVKRFSILGFCSGGRNGYAAAAEDERIKGLILYDTYTYSTIRSRLNRITLLIEQQGFFKTIRGTTRRRTAQVLRACSRLLSQQSSKDSEGDWLQNQPSREEFAARLHHLCDRAVRVAVMYSGEGVDYNYREQFAKAMAGLGIIERLDFAYLPEMDHTAMQLAEQSKFMDWIESWTVQLHRDHTVNSHQADALVS
jgi:pimeloyl-ACP methyl ester carboxylesterase